MILQVGYQLSLSIFWVGEGSSLRHFLVTQSPRWRVAEPRCCGSSAPRAGPKDWTNMGLKMGLYWQSGSCSHGRIVVYVHVHIYISNTYI